MSITVHLQPLSPFTRRVPGLARSRHRWARLLGIPAAIMAISPPAVAHDAPKGWSYPHACCSGYDCREVSPDAVGSVPEGYVITRTGEVVGYTDKRLRDSPDGEYHWCSVAGANDSRTICLFVPPSAY